MRTSTCKAGPPAPGGGCLLAGDEVITTFQYEPDNLLLRSKTVDAGGLSLTTCYAYDALGNRTRETSPRGAAACS